ncbi:MAG: hypothetical protein ACREKK_12085, partial [Candidatus Methylomirabilales bacterium]
MDDRKLLDSLPLPLARGYRRFRNAAAARERHDAAFYLFEIYLKYAASVAIASYLHGPRRDHRVNAALKGLARPSLGEWLSFLRECSRFLGAGGEAEPWLAALAGLFHEKGARREDLLQLYNRLRSFRQGRPSERDKLSLEMVLEEIVSYRNQVLGHGAPLDSGHYERLAEALGKGFAALIEESPFLSARRLVAFESPRVIEGSRVECAVIEFVGLQPLRRDAPLSLPYGAPAPREKLLHLLSPEGAFLPVDPLLIAHAEDVYFLNEAAAPLRGARMGENDSAPEYLSYSTGERHRPAALGKSQKQLLERILGIELDEAGLSRIGDDLAPPPSAAKLAPGEEGQQKLGDFRIVREIGRGAMGVVFEAVQ